MRRRQRFVRLNSVGTRFNYALSAAVALALLAFAAILIISDFRTASRELEERTRLMTELAVESLEIPMWTLDDLTISKIVASFLKDETIAYMGVFDGEKKVAELTQPPFSGRGFTYFRESSNFVVDAEDIVHSGGVIGQVKLAISRDRIYGALARNMTLVLALSALILVTILATSRLIARRYITRPLLSLGRSATAIAHGDLEARITVGGDDEIGRLADDLGAMRDAIKRLVEDLRSSKNELEEYNRTLGQSVRDRTAELELAMIAAKDANRAKSEFLANMSHELRTPLNAIIGFTDFVIENEDEPITEEQKASLSQVLKAGRHLLVLINDVLDLSKIEAGAISLLIEAVDAGQVIDECVSLTASFAAGRNVELHNLVAAADLPAIKADRVRFKQAFLNLLTNAIKYNKDAGNVFIERAPAEPGRLRIGVRDEGPGIPEEKLAKLFDPFDRLGAENSAIEGTGIGLTITKNLIEQMSGKISADSIVGKGATFWLEMPISERAAAHRIDRGEAESGLVSDIKGLLLYIEDNPANLELVRKIMSVQPGIDFINAPTGELGIERARAEVPDVILLDINLPGVDGFQVLETLGVMPETRNIPVIALTAAATEADVRRGQAAGFFSYLTKPIAARQLMATIRRALRPAASASDDTPPLRPRGKVLVVDDLPINLAIAQKQLAKLGVACDTVDDPVRALEMLKSGGYALALVDIGMPVLNGIELTRRLREAERQSGAHTPVIALTANYGSEEDIGRYRKAGMDGQLTKPVILKELASTLHRWFSQGNESVAKTLSAPVRADAPAAGSRPPIDLKQFKEILGSDDEGMIREMFDLFVALMPGELENLANAVAARDTTQSRDAAHRFKSAALNAAAGRLSELLQKIEREAPEGMWETLDTDLQRVRDECSRVRDYVR